MRGFAGVTLAGAVPFAIPAALHARTATRRAERGLPALLLTSEARREELAATGAGFEVASLERLLATSAPAGDPRLVEVDPEAPAFLQLTSGTTGEPRLAQLSHRAIAAWRRSIAGAFDSGTGDVLVGWVPPWHVMGLVRFVLQPILTGVVAHLVPPEVGRLAEWLETVARVRGTFTSAPDFALRTAVRMVGDRPLDLGSLRLVVTGGEPVRLATIRAFESRFDLPGIVRPAYGLSEATLAVTAVAPGEPLEVDATGNVSCGRPLPGFELRLVDAAGAECAAGAPGEILVRSASLFSGYFEAAGPDRGLLRDGWLTTGDWGRLGAHGELYVLGRRRNLLKHGGATYAPRELEDAAIEVPGIVARRRLRCATGRAAKSSRSWSSSARRAPRESRGPRAGGGRVGASRARHPAGRSPGRGARHAAAHRQRQAPPPRAAPATRGRGARERPDPLRPRRRLDRIAGAASGRD